MNCIVLFRFPSIFILYNLFKLLTHKIFTCDKLTDFCVLRLFLQFHKYRYDILQIDRNILGFLQDMKRMGYMVWNPSASQPARFRDKLRY